MKKFDYFNGCGWTTVDEDWLKGVNLTGLEEVYASGRGCIRCVYENGEEVFYQDVHGTWGAPFDFH